MALRLRYGMLADYATQGERGKRTVVGIFDNVFHMGEGPSIVLPRSFLVASFAASALDGTDHELELRVVNEAGDAILPEPIRIPLKFTALGPDTPMRAEINIELAGFRLPGLGEYEFQFWSGGNYIGGIDLGALRPLGTPPPEV